MSVRYAVGVDVGGTKCLAVVVEVHDTSDGAPPVVRPIGEARVDTPESGDAALVAAIAEVVRDLPHHEALGIGLPGLVDRRRRLWAAPNLRLAQPLDIVPALSTALRRDPDAPFAVDNDATCATVAEWRLGAGRRDGVPVADMVAVTLGTGIGGGIVAGGRLQRGHNGFAGEIGHMVVDPAGPLCPCGRRGCWERYSSGSGLAWLAGGRRGEDVVADARAGDVVARGVIAEFGRYTGLGLANLTNLLDPERFVIAGGLVSSADVVLPAIRAGLREALYSPESRPHPEVLMAELGESAGAIGAALLALGFD